MNTDRKVEIIAYHGWGMTADFWDEWDSLLGEQVIFKKNDRGYFHKPVSQHFSEPDSIKVLFVQGFGIHMVSQSDWRMADFIVLFSTFRHLKDIIAVGKNPEHIITALKREIKKRPEYTIDLFWEELFKADQDFRKGENYVIENKELLTDDLDVYHANIVIKPTIKKGAKVILLETEMENITNYPQDRAMKDLFGKLDLYKRFELVGHGFPFYNADVCFDYLSEHLKIF